MLLIAADPPKYTMVAANEAHARAFGTTPAALEGRGVLEVFPADPPPQVAQFMAAIRRSLDAVVASGQPDQMGVRPYMAQWRDGEAVERFATAVNSPIKDGAGRVTHILSASQDVTGEVHERRSEEARRLLMREVDHRARNALTVVQSFVRLTEAADLASFRENLSGRVEALARAQTSLAARRWEGADLKELIGAELAAISATGRYRLEGPPVTLKPHHVQSMSMAIHELATNAAKYGALSTAAGGVEVSWSRTGQRGLVLSWTERAGPPVVPPRKLGFGARLIAELARQLHGDVRYDWRCEGLRVEIDLRPER
jgi:two-component sensor histidine kinase